MLRGAVVGACALLALTGCAPVVALDPAPDATNTLCADVIVHLPDSVDDLASRETSAQGTGAWGEPTAVVLACGVDVPRASPLRCVTIDGIDWLEDDSAAPRYLFTTFGREPAVHVLIDTDATTPAGASVAPGLVLTDLAGAVSATKPNGLGCTAISDTLT